MKNPKNIVAPLESSEEYAKQKAKLSELQTKLSGVDRRTMEARNKRHEYQGSEHASQKASRVAELTGDPASEAAEHLSKLPALALEASDLRAAITVIESKLAQTRATASRGICERVEPEYRRRVAAICGALIELNAKFADYAAIVDELQAKDIAFAGYLRPMQPHFLGRPNDRQGTIANYLREAAANKMIDRSLIPTELK